MGLTVDDVLALFNWFTANIRRRYVPEPKWMEVRFSPVALARTDPRNLEVLWGLREFEGIPVHFPEDPLLTDYPHMEIRLSDGLKWGCIEAHVGILDVFIDRDYSPMGPSVK